MNHTAQELSWALSRKGSPNSIFADDPTATPFQKALSEFEAANYLECLAKWPGRAYMLNQDAKRHPQKTAASGMLMTIIKNAGVIMADTTKRSDGTTTEKRWIFPNEMLASQGFPTTKALLRAATKGREEPVCSFNIARESFVDPSRRRPCRRGTAQLLWGKLETR